MDAVAIRAERSGQQELAGMPPRLYAASPSRLLAWLDCPRSYRMRYLDRPRPPARPPRAHTSLGVSTHNALRDWWDLPAAQRTPGAGARLVRQAWIHAGFRDAEQSARWQERTSAAVSRYLEGVSGGWAPRGTERTVSLKTPTLALAGRIDRLDDRGGEIVVVDYKTSRVPSTRDEARTSLPLALYAIAAARMFRQPCTRVELHHVPTGTVVGHDHTPESLERKLGEAESIAADLRSADADHAERSTASSRFEARPSALCSWCDYRSLCPDGQRMGPEKSSWAALDGET